MAKTKKQRTLRQLVFKPILAATLACAGVFNMMSAVLAEGTAAGTGISNTATATYSDGTTNFDAISNTVIVNVAEVAGLTVTSSGFNDVNGGSIVNGDVLTYDFTVTNTGNAPTYVFVPGADNIVVDNAIIVDGTTDVTIVDPITNAVLGTVPAAGDSTENILAAAANAGVIPADGNFVVRVTVQVTGTSVGDDVSVQFGNTTEEGDNSQNQQNVEDTSTQTNDVRTLNFDDPTVAGTDAPVNGEREAAAFREELYATAVTEDLAQARITKTSAYSDSGTTAVGTDDVINYSLSLEVLNDTFPGITPGNLEGTDILVDRGSGAATENRILVSDAVPAGTVFNGTTGTPGANWEVVYSLNDPAVTGDNALEASWTTTAPADLSLVKRIGFIYDSTANGAIAPTTSPISSFSFGVVTSNITLDINDQAFVANVAQVFGETEGEPNGNIVFDESGDQQANNYDNGVDPTSTSTTFEDADTGIGDPNDGEGTPNANQGVGPDGESNVVTITVVPIPPSAGDLLNGPVGAAPAVGPTSNNDDFTNAAVAIAPAEVGQQGDAITTPPGPAVISNTVAVPAATANQLDTITLLPISPSEAATAAELIDNGVADGSFTGTYGADADLPDGTSVTIEFNGQSAEYTYTAAGGFSPVGGATPVVVGTLNPGDDETYTVTIQLPAAGTEQITGYGVPIAAFVDNDSNGDFTPATESIANITIDRVYTGFMTLFKEASVNGGAFTDNPVTDAEPGQEIVYRITYANISEEAPAGGGGNVVLNANNFVLTEDGNATINGSTDNNWAGTTFHKVGTTVETGTSVEYFNGGTSLGTTEPADETVAPSLVTIYQNDVGVVVPQQSGEMTFTREVQ